MLLETHWNDPVVCTAIATLYCPIWFYFDVCYVQIHKLSALFASDWMKLVCECDFQQWFFPQPHSNSLIFIKSLVKKR